jgi:hypothetical protein
MKAFIHRILGASAILFTVPLAAQVPCSIDALGGLPGVDPVTIVGDIILPPECSLDFGDREVILEGNIRALDLTLIATQMTILEKGVIEGGPGTTTVVLKVGRSHPGDLTVLGALTNDGSSGGTIDILAGGAVEVNRGLIQASARDPAGHGGFISIDAQGFINTALPATGVGIQALSGESAEFNGEVSIVSHQGAMNLGGGIAVSGGTLSPGVVTIDGALGLELTAPISAGGHCASGACSRAGLVRITSGRDLGTGAILVPGADDAVDAGDGDGGRVEIAAAGDISLNGDVLLTAGESSRGGSFTVFAGGSYHQGDKSIDAGSTKSTSSGGSIFISARDFSFFGDILAQGGDAGVAGSIQIVAEQSLAVDGNLIADGNSPSTGIELVSINNALKVTGPLNTQGRGDFGTGGPVSLLAVTGIDLDGSIRASGAGPFGLGGAVKLDSFLAAHIGGQAAITSNGDSADPKIGEGGTIDVRACVLTIDPGADFQASGQFGGGIFITTSDGASLPGKFQASVDGLIQIEFPTDLPPDLGGATFTPDPTLVATDSLAPCALPTPCDPVTDLACTTDGTTATLSWSDSPTDTGVQVLRDGGVVATLGPGEEGFSEGGLAPGPHTYVVQASCRGRPATAATCDVKVSTGVTFLRGDCNASGDRDISDGVTVLSFLFLGAPARLKCEKACDCNDDGSLDVSDGVFILAFLFSDPTKIPPPPFERCGLDGKEDTLSCESFGACPR